MTRIARNGPCPCGSGRKYKGCCAAVERAQAEYQEAFRAVVDTRLKIARIAFGTGSAARELGSRKSPELAAPLLSLLLLHGSLDGKAPVQPPPGGSDGTAPVEGLSVVAATERTSELRDVRTDATHPINDPARGVSGGPGHASLVWRTTAVERDCVLVAHPGTLPIGVARALLRGLGLLGSGGLLNDIRVGHALISIWHHALFENVVSIEELGARWRESHSATLGVADAG